MGGGMANLARPGTGRAFDQAEKRFSVAGRPSGASAAEAVKGVVVILPAASTSRGLRRHRAKRGAARLIDVRRSMSQRTRGRRGPESSASLPRRAFGGIAAAAGGTLTLMVGGTDEQFERAAALEPMAR
jgi:3-hydroxyisobutyrate dehydrogenase